MQQVALLPLDQLRQQPRVVAFRRAGQRQLRAGGKIELRQVETWSLGLGPVEFGKFAQDETAPKRNCRSNAVT